MIVRGKYPFSFIRIKKDVRWLKIHIADIVRLIRIVKFSL